MFLFLSRDTDRHYAIVSHLSVRPSAMLVHVHLRFSVSVSWSYSFEFVKQPLICSKGIIMKFEVNWMGCTVEQEAQLSPRDRASSAHYIRR